MPCSWALLMQRTGVGVAVGQAPVLAGKVNVFRIDSTSVVVTQPSEMPIQGAASPPS